MCEKAIEDIQIDQMLHPFEYKDSNLSIITNLKIMSSKLIATNGTDKMHYKFIQSVSPISQVYK